MTAVALTAARAVRAVPRVGVLDGLFFLTLFTTTFEKVHWSTGAQVGIADVLTLLFLAGYALNERGAVPRSTVTVLGFFAVFLLVYLFGYYNISTPEGISQFAKGMAKFLVHFLFLGAALAYVVRRGERFFWVSLSWFAAGFVVNAVYGIAQLLFARLGVNLDSVFLSPLTGGASSINVYGAVNGQSVYRPNALTGDPNHLGVMLDVPLLALTPVYLRLERTHRYKWHFAGVLAFLLLVELSTLSRSGLLGLAVGVLVLLLPYRGHLRTRALLAPLAALGVVLALVVATRWHYFWVVIHSRIQTGGGSTSVHFQIYSFVPAVIHMHPLLGLGLNNFSVYYQQVTGKTNWGPHSYFVALVVETGLIGLLVYVAFLGYLFRRLAAAQRLGKALDALRDPVARRVRPLSFGLTAALAGTLAANFFYLTLQFYYVFVFAVFVLALPLVFAHRAAAAP